MTAKRAVLLLVLIGALAGCSREDLRGDSTKSGDGKTYLMIKDDNGRQCSPMKVDDRVWPHAIGEAGPIAPGVHTVACGESGTVQIEVRAGTTYHFDYWGP